MCVRVCVCVLNEWKLAHTFIDYIVHWAQSHDEATSFKICDIVMTSDMMRVALPKCMLLRECKKNCFGDSPSKVFVV